jgi:hypothetical protein
MKKIRNFLNDKAGAITLGLGISNLGIYILENDPYILIIGVALLAVGIADWCAEFDKDV